jgi:hypothetical protein
MNMVQEKFFRYLGRNGTITSPVKLENIEPIPMIRLKAEHGKVLVNGSQKVYAVLVFEDEINDWKEIDDIGQN